MKAEYKIERLGESVIAKAHRFHKLMQLNAKCWKESKNKTEKNKFEEGVLMYRARWSVCMDIIEELGIEDKYYDTIDKEEQI